MDSFTSSSRAGLSARLFGSNLILTLLLLGVLAGAAVAADDDVSANCRASLDRTAGGGCPNIADVSPMSYTDPLPTGVRLDPVGDAIELGSVPLGMAVAPGGDKVAVVLSGWREQGLQIVDLKSRQVT